MLICTDVVLEHCAINNGYSVTMCQKLGQAVERWTATPGSKICPIPSADLQCRAFKWTETTESYILPCRVAPLLWFCSNTTQETSEIWSRSQSMHRSYTPASQPLQHFWNSFPPEEYAWAVADLEFMMINLNIMFPNKLHSLDCLFSTNTVD